MIKIKDWVIIHGTRSEGRPTVSRILWGIVKSDPSHYYEIGESCVSLSIESVEAGIVKTEGDIYQLTGEGREIQIPNFLIPDIRHMTKEKWSNFVKNIN